MLDVEITDIDTHWVGINEARERLHAIDAALADMHEPLSGMIDDLHRQSDAQFASLGGAAGTPWDPLDPSTVSNKMRMGYPAPGWPLVASGELRQSAVGHGPYSYGDTADMSASFGLEWAKDGYNIAALQQWGVPWRPVTQHRHHADGSPYTVTYMWHLPSRPMIVATDQLLEAGADRLVAHLFNPLA